MCILPISLYHGTSTLFLNSIAETGLGGKNPLSDWKVLEFAKTIFPLVKEHFSQDERWMVKAETFGSMVEQKTAAMNFQHGDTYLSPSLFTAVRYAVDKRYGSELLSYTLDFLDELIRRKVPGVVDNLYRQFPHIFGFLDISCAPLLVEVRNVPTAHLLNEHGGDPGENVTQIRSCLQDHSEIVDTLLQQTNFRLCKAAPIADLTFWLVNVSRWDPYLPDYTLHLLSAPGAYNNGGRQSRADDDRKASHN